MANLRTIRDLIRNVAIFSEDVNDVMEISWDIPPGPDWELLGIQISIFETSR